MNLHAIIVDQRLSIMHPNDFVHGKAADDALKLSIFVHIDSLYLRLQMHGEWSRHGQRYLDCLLTSTIINPT